MQAGMGLLKVGTVKLKDRLKKTQRWTTEHWQDDCLEINTKGGKKKIYFSLSSCSLIWNLTSCIEGVGRGWLEERNCKKGRGQESIAAPNKGTVSTVRSASTVHRGLKVWEVKRLKRREEKKKWSNSNYNNKNQPLQKINTKVWQ